MGSTPSEPDFPEVPTLGETMKDWMKYAPEMYQTYWNALNQYNPYQQSILTGLGNQIAGELGYNVIETGGEDIMSTPLSYDKWIEKNYDSSPLKRFGVTPSFRGNDSEYDFLLNLFGGNQNNLTEQDLQEQYQNYVSNFVPGVTGQTPKGIDLEEIEGFNPYALPPELEQYYSDIFGEQMSERGLEYSPLGQATTTKRLAELGIAERQNRVAKAMSYLGIQAPTIDTSGIMNYGLNAANLGTTQALGTYNAQTSAQNSQNEMLSGLFGGLGTLGGAMLTKTTTMLCIPEGSDIELENGTQKVEELQEGDIIKGGKVLKIRKMFNGEDFFYCDFDTEKGNVIASRDHPIYTKINEIKKSELKTDYSYDILTETGKYYINGVELGTSIKENENV